MCDHGVRHLVLYILVAVAVVVLLYC
jgi:hypothetical protein